MHHTKSQLKYFSCFSMISSPQDSSKHISICIHKWCVGCAIVTIVCGCPCPCPFANFNYFSQNELQSVDVRKKPGRHAVCIRSDYSQRSCQSPITIIKVIKWCACVWTLLSNMPFHANPFSRSAIYSTWVMHWDGNRITYTRCTHTHELNQFKFVLHNRQIQTMIWPHIFAHRKCLPKFFCFCKFHFNFWSYRIPRNGNRKSERRNQNHSLLNRSPWTKRKFVWF